MRKWHYLQKSRKVLNCQPENRSLSNGLWPVKMPMKEKTRKSPARCISISLDLTQLIPEPFDESVVWKMFTFCFEQAVEVDASQCLHVPFTWHETCTSNILYGSCKSPHDELLRLSKCCFYPLVFISIILKKLYRLLNLRHVHAFTFKRSCVTFGYQTVRTCTWLGR